MSVDEITGQVQSNQQLVQNSSNKDMETDNAVTSVTDQKMGKKQFLKLLITQMQNQNPLDPMDSKNFSEQLAQFSQVEQLNNMSDGFDKSNEINKNLSDSINQTLTTSLVGKKVKCKTNKVVMNQDGEGRITFELDGFAKNANIKIKNSEGEVVRNLNRNDLSKGMNVIEWNGKNAQGNAVPTEGNYSFEVSATDGQGNSVESKNITLGQVTGVNYQGDKTYLIVDGNKIPYESVVEVRK